MTADEKWEGRWKKLKKYIETDLETCREEIGKYKQQGKEEKVQQWAMCADTNRMTLDEMARLEKED